MKMTEVQFNEAQEEYAGYCSHCDKMTATDVEPDADGYECEECGNLTVMGAENALILEHIEITDEEDDDDQDEDSDEGGMFLD